MKRSIFFLAFTLVFHLAQSQITFEKTFGVPEYTEVGNSVLQTIDGGYIISGRYSYPSPTSDLILLKIDENGNEVWMKTYADCTGGNSVKQIQNGGYIVTGRSNLNFKALLLKTDENGDELWRNTYGESNYCWGYSVEQTSDGGYIITGMADGNYPKLLLVKTDGDGNEEWTKTIEEGAPGEAVIQTNDGGYIITGMDQSYSGNVILIKTDQFGNTDWIKTYNWGDSSFGSDVQQTQDGGYIITGSTEGYIPFNYDSFLIKTNNLGDTIWTRLYADNSSNFSSSIDQTIDGGYILTGLIGEYEDLDLMLIKTDINGNLIWKKLYGHSTDQSGYSIQQTSDNGYIIAGEIQDTLTQDYNIYLIKTNQNGIVQINENNEATRAYVEVYPNPSCGIFNVESIAGVKEITVFNINGEQVYFKNFVPEYSQKIEEVDLTEFPNGIFFINVHIDRAVTTKKIIKRK